MPSGMEEVRAGGFTCIDAKVPGNVEIDLCAAGMEGDPFYGVNIYHFRKYEFYQWWFERNFEVTKGFIDDSVILRFHGINTFATIWVNGRLCGKTDNMLIEHDIDVTDAIKPGENHIAIRIESPVNKLRDRDFPVNVKGNENHDEYVWLRMCAHSFGWDIAPRLLSAGMWRDIELVSGKNTGIKQVYYAVRTLSDGCAELLVKYRFITDSTYLNGFSVKVRGSCKGHEFAAERRALFLSGEMVIHIEDAKLWWPRGYGEANLYDMSFELIKDGEAIDTRRERIGLRKVDIETASGTQFKIAVNNQPILAKGANWSALDALHSRDAERLNKAHDLMQDLGCNIVRCCGLNVYEDHGFFDLCDERGMMVWQDFALACGIYPQNDEFANIIEKESTFIIKKLRNHPSLILWAGDNEGDLLYYDSVYRLSAAKYNRISRDVLFRSVGSHDPFRLYIPSSPYIPDLPDYLSENKTSDRDVPEQHCWGPRGYFKGDYYTNCPASFISEIGYHGCPGTHSIKQFISPEKLWPYQNNGEWDTHNTDYLLAEPRHYNRNELMAKQVRLLFGNVPESLGEFVAASQICQAEALKFFIENVRLSKWEKTGIIWWNLIDCWPEFSDAVVDYYFNKKLAYHYVKRVMEPVCIMMSELRDMEHRVYVGNDSLQDIMINYSVCDGVTGKEMLSGSVLSKANENTCIGAVTAREGQRNLYVMKWEAGGRLYANHYISGCAPLDLASYRFWLNQIELLPEPFDSRCLFL